MIRFFKEGGSRFKTAVFLIWRILLKDADKMDSVVKGIVSRDWKGLQMVSLDRFEV
jgi:hypothetical protein